MRPAPALYAEWPVLRVSHNGQTEGASRRVAEEVPVQLIYNELLAYAIMMVTPADLEDFALGFSLSERVVDNASAVKAVRFRQEGDTMALHITIARPDFQKLLRRGRRTLGGYSGCGLCGVESMESLEVFLPHTPSGPAFSMKALRNAFSHLRDHQTLNAPVNMLHAAAWTTVEGEIRFVREDIGRHNALDKLIGALRREGVSLSEGMCLLTSRCSFEMAQKAVLAGMRCLAALSAPTGRALRVAQEAGLAVVICARDGTQTIFCGQECFEKNWT